MMEEYDTPMAESSEAVQASAPAPRPVAKKKPAKKKPVKKVTAKKVQVKREEAQVEEEAPVKVHEVTTPWRPARILNAPSISGFRTRWVNTRKEGREEAALDEGWVYVSPNEVKGAIQRTLKDGSVVDGKVRRRELVLMKMPESMAQAKEKWLADRTMTPEKMAEKLEHDMTSITGKRGHSIFQASRE